VPDKIKTLFEGLSKMAYIDRVARNAVGVAIKDVKAAETQLDAVLELFGSLLRDVERDQEKVLDIFGAQGEWREGQEVVKELRSITAYLQDLIIHLLEGSLRDSYRGGRLAFQCREQ
jgi:hypothetical protein